MNFLILDERFYQQKALRRYEPMKKFFVTVVICIFVIGLFSIPAKTQTPSNPLNLIVGTWKTMDDEGPNKGKASSYIEIFENSGAYSGKIVKLLLDPPDKTCEQCKGTLKNKPLIGLVILNGMKKTGTTDKKLGEEFSGGTILDPDSGSVYKCKMWVNGDLLTVRGYIGVSLFGRSQEWQKVK
jgi:uncharacterized protein (DUF2147 family)